MTKRRTVANGSNPVRARAQNLTVVLDALRKLQPVSRTDLALATNLTPATITNLVGELSDLGFIREQRSPEKQLGRRPTLVSLEPSAVSIIGLEISRTYVLGVTTNLSGEVVRSEKRSAPAQHGAKATLRIVHEVIAELWDENPPFGIGVGVPGPVDTAQGRVREPPNFPGWRDVPLTRVLRDRWGVPVFIDDDAKTAALGEYWFGAGSSVESLLYLSVGSGVGAGLIVRGELYRGTHELAGEIGHTTLDLDGPPCECGNRGCLETFVSTAAIEKEAASRGLAGEESAKNDDQKGETSNLLARVERLAAEGDARAAGLKNRTYRYLAAGVINAVNFYDPDLIVVGGELAQTWTDVAEELLKRVRGRSFGFASSAVALCPSHLGGYASVIGAAGLVTQFVFEQPYLIGKQTGTAV